jgi:hypothetical protein
MNAPGEGGAAPLTEEDRFSEVAEAVDNTREQERKAPPVRETPPPAAEGGDQGGQGGAQDRGGGVPRVRDPATGKFAPEPEPFAGFNALPKEQQDYIRKLRREHHSATTGYSTAQRELETLRRTRAQPPRPAPNASQPPPPDPSKQPPAKPKLEKWEARAKEFPDDYASIEERIAASESELGRSLTAQETRIAKLEQEVQETRRVTSQYQADKAVEQRTRTKGYLDEVSPAWRYTAGWEDENGNPIPKGQQKLRPEFDAWLQAQPPKIRLVLQAQLDHDDPELIGDVFQRFDRDYAAVLDWQEQHGGQASRGTHPQPPPQRPAPPSRRQAALTDVQPRPGSGGAAPRAEPAPVEGSAFDREEAAFDAATNDQNLRRWRGQR